jgi:pimeloyl-ACP methyl ester carboxylesterase
MWWWAPVARRLERSAITSTAVALPSCGETGVAPTGAGPGLEDDAAATTSVLDDAREPVILVAHSYGGMVAAEAGDHPAVHALVYISSYLPVVGEDLVTVTTGPNPVPVIQHDDGSVSVDDRDPRATDARFLHDVTDPELIRGAHERLCAQSAAVFGAATTKAAWERKPSTYLVCADERSTDPELQRAHAARATTVHELAAGHFPFLSRPDLVAARIEAIGQDA